MAVSRCDTQAHEYIHMYIGKTEGFHLFAAKTSALASRSSERELMFRVDPNAKLISGILAKCSSSQLHNVNKVMHFLKSLILFFSDFFH